MFVLLLCKIMLFSSVCTPPPTKHSNVGNDHKFVMLLLKNDAIRVVKRINPWLGHSNFTTATCDKYCGKQFIFLFTHKNKNNKKKRVIQDMVDSPPLLVNIHTMSAYGTETDGKKWHIVTNKAEPAVTSASWCTNYVYCIHPCLKLVATHNLDLLDVD